MTQEQPTKAWGLEALRLSRDARRKQLEENAPQRDCSIQRNRYYYDAVKRLLRYIVEPGKRVLEVRCATGHLLDRILSKQVEVGGGRRAEDCRRLWRERAANDG